MNLPGPCKGALPAAGAPGFKAGQRLSCLLWSLMRPTSLVPQGLAEAPVNDSVGVPTVAPSIPSWVPLTAGPSLRLLVLRSYHCY